MRTLLRRLRGIAATSLLWGVGWSIAMAALVSAGAVWSVLRDDVGVDAFQLLRMAAISGAVLGGLYGLWSGAAFAVILTVAERRRRLAELSVKRMAVWGALGGVALPLLHVGTVALNADQMPTDTGFFLALSAALGAGFAAGTISLVRRGESPVDPNAGGAPGTLPPPHPFDAAPGGVPVRDAVGG